jgi:hypothetical protein
LRCKRTRKNEYAYFASHTHRMYIHSHVHIYQVSPHNRALSLRIASTAHHIKFSEAGSKLVNAIF